MNKKQRIILIFAVIAYLFVLYSFLTKNLWVLLASFVISSALLVAFNVAGNDKEEEEKTEMELISVKEELDKLNQEKAELQGKLSESESNLEKANEESENLRKEMLSKEDEIAKVRQEVIEAMEKAENFEKEAVKGALGGDLSSLLPPVKNAVEDEDEINIVDVAKKAIENLKPYASKVGVEIRLNASKDCFKVKGSFSRYEIMFRNIIDNSVKYMKTTGSLVITISDLEDKVFIVLKDNGEGLPEEETEYVFDLNFQGSNRISGNGLGLTQSKAIVSHYGGNIYAKSSDGRGMGVYIELPGKDA